jgi:hypothetical protein
MKPLWNAPSLGTLRAGSALAVVFLIVTFGWLFVAALIVVAPLGIVLRAAWRKRPYVVWRAAVLVSLAASLLIVVPNSPVSLSDRIYISFSERPAELVLLSPGPQLAMWTALVVLAELPLLPLLVATTIHTHYSHRQTRSR